MKRLLNLLFGCTHRNYSFPYTEQRDGQPRTYVVCHDCCKAVPYDWQKMRIRETA